MKIPYEIPSIKIIKLDDEVLLTSGPCLTDCYADCYANCLDVCPSQCASACHTDS